MQTTPIVENCKKYFKPPVHRGVTKNIVYNEKNGENFKDPISCVNSGNNWTKDRCACNIGYFGPKCEEELLSDNYYNLGNVDNDFSKAKTVDSLSFTGKSCSTLCDLTRGCEGFLYQDKKCQLIGELVVGENNNLQYDYSKNGNLYYKKNNRPKFNDRGFLYYGSLPLRFWNDFEKVQTVYNNQVVMLKFLPENGISDNPNGTFLFSESKDFSKGKIVSRKANGSVSGLELTGVIYAKYVIGQKEETKEIPEKVSEVRMSLKQDTQIKNDKQPLIPLVIEHEPNNSKKTLRKISKNFSLRYKELSDNIIRLEKDSNFTDNELLELKDMKIIYKIEITNKIKTYVAEKEIAFTESECKSLKGQYKGKEVFVLEITI